jgi:hypothetical protein
VSAKQLFEKLQDQIPALSWEKIAKDIGNEVVHQVAAGAHELAAAIHNGQAFVMYQRGSKDDDKKDHGVHGPEVQAPETLQMDNGNDTDRGGRGR